MNNTQSLNHNFETIAWGALFLWWGLTELVNFLPTGSGTIGVGLILLGLNAARSLNGIPISVLSTSLGILALLWGGMELAGAVFNLPFELPAFPIFLITLGLLILGREVIQLKNE